jgi:hypothetical protein
MGAMTHKNIAIIHSHSPKDSLGRDYIDGQRSGPPMLFNSFAFVLGFLPIAFAGYFLASRLGGQAGVAFLALASLAFYS